MSKVKYRSGNWTVATPIGLVRHESPLLPELNSVLIFHQDYVQLTANWLALDYNTILDPLDPDPAYLFNESPREDYGGLAVRWTRSYVRVPASYGKAGGTYPFIFPAFDADVSSRLQFQKPVAMEIIRDFFLCGNGGVFASWQDIPIIKGFRPYEIQDDPTDISVDSGNSLRDPAGHDLGTFPSLTSYRALIANGQFIDVEDSKVCNFRGGVYMRERYQVLAQ